MTRGATPRRPEGWTAPGPRPRAPEGLVPANDEDLSFLTGDFRVFQKRRGHRWSLDDLVTAWVARRELLASPPREALDLGCGIASVALMVAWSFPEARVTGIEAQAVSLDLARRSLVWNGVDDRVTLHHGDLRDASMLPDDARFDLVTGTPPYFLADAIVESDVVQRGPCRVEHRGGPEDYARAAALRLREGGRFVMCASMLQRERVREGARAAGLDTLRCVEVVPREGKEVLVLVTVMTPGEGRWPDAAETLTVRTAEHQWTEAFRAVRRDMGMPDAAPRGHAAGDAGLAPSRDRSGS